MRTQSAELSINGVKHVPLDLPLLMLLWPPLVSTAVPFPVLPGSVSFPFAVSSPMSTGSLVICVGIRVRALPVVQVS